MQEIIDIVYFLTKNNVCKDMQKEIMCYYQPAKQKYWLLFIKFESNPSMVYKEVIRYKPIKQINLINLYKFMYETNSDLTYSYTTMTTYDEDGYETEWTNYNDVHSHKKHTSCELLEHLNKFECIPFNIIGVTLSDDYSYYNLCIEEIEI